MAALIGSILILAGSVLIAAGVVAHGLHASGPNHAGVGYILGGILVVAGIVAMIFGPLKRGWDAIPVDDK